MDDIKLVKQVKRGIVALLRELGASLDNSWEGPHEICFDNGYLDISESDLSGEREKSEIEVLKSTLEYRENEILGLKGSLVERDKEIKGISDNLYEYQAELMKAGRKLAEADEKIKDLETQIKALEQALKWVGVRREEEDEKDF